MSTGAPATVGTLHRVGLPLRWLRALASVTAVVVLMLAVVPRVAAAPWSEVAHTIISVSRIHLIALGAVWAGGLLAHTTTLSAALPGLTRRRALTLSLTGSAVANVLPFGGAAGVALNYRMARSWGFDRSAVAAYTVLTNVWDALGKLFLPALALVWLVLGKDVAAGRLVTVSVAATAVLALVSLSGVVMLVNARTAEAVGSVIDGGARTALRWVGSDREVHAAVAITHLRAQCLSLVSASWLRLTTGIVTYTVSLAVLMWGCLHVTGTGLAPAEVFAGFAFERVLTLVGVTPGGAGVVEVALVALLVALGGDPVGSVAGVLLYRTFTYGLEIPVGGVGLATWLWGQRRRTRS